MPALTTDPKPAAVTAPPAARTVTIKSATKPTVVPLVAAVQVTTVIDASAVVPAVPMRTVNVLKFATVLVQVPLAVRRNVVPATQKNAGIVLREIMDVSVVLIAPVATVLTAIPPGD
jgi:hypothetical protein